MAGDELLVEARGGVRLVTLNRPDDLNAADDALHQAVVRVWDDLAADPDAAVVVLTGAGRAFSAGGDFAHLLRQTEDRAAQERGMAEAQALIWGMVRFPLPVIAAVNGPAVGLGCSLALGADIVLVSDRAFFADPHVGVGLACGDGGAALLPLLVPLLRAKELLFTGDRIGAEEAVRIGMANRVVAHDDLLDEALRLAERIAAQPREALLGTKRAVQLGVERAIRDVVEAAAAAELATMASAEHRAIVERLAARATTPRAKDQEAPR